MEVGEAAEFRKKTSHGTKEQNDCVYGMIDLGALEKKPVEVSTYGDDPKTITLVGYIETEADRLLSTGVSMDENSDDYKTVIAQLANPVFYSVNDKFATK